MTRPKMLPQVILLALLLGASAPSQAWEVLGCTFVGNVPGFIACVNGASSQALNNAGKAYQNTIGGLEEQIATLQSSPYLAQLPGEQQALLALRQMPIEPFRICLAEAGMNLGAVMGGAMTNPVSFAEARINHLFAKMAEVSGPLLDGGLADLPQRAPTPASPQTIAQAVNHAYAALTRLAQEDPVARCALPLLAAHQTQIKQVALSVYATAEARTSQLVTQTVQPVLNEAMTSSLGTMLTGLRADPLASDAVRRSAGAIRQASSGVRAAASSTVAAAIPDDVRRIALAVFAERMLDPRRLQALTGEINGLSAALAGGMAGSFDPTDLNKLIVELSTPGGELATEIGIEVTRFYGHWTIDTVGGLIVDSGVGSAAAAEAVAMEVGGAICSIGDVFSGVPCAIIKGIVSFVYLQVALPLLNQSLMALYHVQYEQMVNCAAQAIRLGQDPALRSQAGCGSLGPALRHFPTGEQLMTLTLPELDAARAALFAYQSAVGNLAIAARHAGGAARRR